MKKVLHFTAHIGARLGLTLAACGIFATAMLCPAAENKPGEKNAIDPRADEWLRRLSDYLGQAKSFSVRAEVWQDFQLSSGQRLQADRMLTIQLRRPNHLHVTVKSPRRDRELLYDGAAISLLDRAHNFYGTVKTSGSLDDAMDTAAERFGIAMPLEDFLRSNPHKDLLRNVDSAMDVSTVNVMGVPCEHLAFTQTNIDWQVWIETSTRPVPKKFLITYKDEPDSPQFTAIFSHWDFNTALPDFVFKFEPPSGATQISVQEIKEQHLSHNTPSK